ncbi:heme-binding protein [Isosphaera pallida ATCC 43644]|uniref:Heme-binding protein n=1 Tax=Isosphaera pallida (strain ATCC 43644 / DSM 9630 / IS1B) TaxID=575540 RepID=E8QY80_ISOPI|nr:heme-binding protein [Isosphaera pallida ATCC 43644]
MICAPFSMEPDNRVSRLVLGSLLGLGVLLVQGGSTIPAKAQDHDGSQRVDVILNGQTFTIPQGFSLERAASPELVQRPITAAFDEQGRLYVADSSGVNAPVQEQLRDPSHRVVRLEDTTGDGVFDRASVFAERIMFPEGTLWHDGSLYVAAPPQIWKLTDADDDGVAERREVWYDGGTLTGCANDLHGPYLGRDGWIYWTKGAFAEQPWPGPYPGPATSRAAHIFRARPDGSQRETVMTGGMDNPVDLVATPSGERIFTTTFLQHPGGGLRDGLIHAVYGAVYGKIHGVTDPHPHTRPEPLPPLVHLGPAAPSGLELVETDTLEPNASGALLLTAQFNLRRVSAHRLIPQGATYRTEDRVLVESNHADFHPTDVLEDADGSVLILDTGAWYKLCCPTSQLVDPQVLGAIYRLKPLQGVRRDDPWGRRLDWSSQASIADLTARLADPRPAVRRRAARQLADHSRTAVVVAALKRASDPKMIASAAARREAVWVLGRIETPEARAAIRRTLRHDPDPETRQAAAHLIGLHRDQEALETLRDALNADQPDSLRRAVAEALGRLRMAKAIDPLLNALERCDDQTLKHSIIFALIESEQTATLSDRLARNFADGSDRCLEGLMIALAESPGAVLDPVRFAEVHRARPGLRPTLEWLAIRHARLTLALAPALLDLLTERDLEPSRRETLEAALARMLATPRHDFDRLVASRLTDRDAPPVLVASLLRVLARTNRTDQAPPDAWIEATAGFLDHGPPFDPDQLALALAVARTWSRYDQARRRFTPFLEAWVGQTQLDLPRRLDALAALGENGLKPPSQTAFALLKACLADDASFATRSRAADLLVNARLTAAQWRELVERLPDLGPIEVSKLLALFETHLDETAALRALEQIETHRDRWRVRPEELRDRFAKQSPRVIAEVRRLAERLDAANAARVERINRLLARLDAEPSDPRRGRDVFNSAKAACVECHAMGYVGGKVGPDLTRIGAIRSERDLLEAILEPSASFVRGYEPIVVELDDGRILSGIVKEESGDTFTLRLSATQEERVSRSRVEAVHPGGVSLMPAGLENQLDERDLLDLIAFLKASR